MIKDSFKIRVNSLEESMYIQELLFMHGSQWRTSKKEFIGCNDDDVHWRGLYHYDNGNMNGDTNCGNYFEKS